MIESKKVAAGVLVLLMTASAQAGFQKSAPSIVGEAMGGASTARAGNASTLFVNPAGMAALSRGEATFVYGSLYAGLPGVSHTQGALATALPVGARWTMGLGATDMNADGLLREQEGILGAAFRPNRTVAMGLNVTYLKHSYQAGEEASTDASLMKGTSKGAVGVDAGVLIRLPKVNVGLAGRHLNQPDLGIVEEDPAPRELRAGVSGRVFGKVVLVADVMNRNAGDVVDGSRTTWGVGGEVPVAEVMSIRAGVGTDQVTAGLGFTINDLRIDYAFGLSANVKDNSGTHRMAVSYAFGAKRPGIDSGWRTTKVGSYGGPWREKTGVRTSPAGRKP
jgi:hypothetical protein